MEIQEKELFSVEDMSAEFGIKKEGIYKQLVKYNFDSKMVIDKGVKCLKRADFEEYKKIREANKKYAKGSSATNTSITVPEAKNESPAEAEALKREIELYKKIIEDKDKQLEEKNIIIESKNKELENKDRQAERFMKLLEDNNNTIKLLNNSLAQLNGTLQLKEVNTLKRKCTRQ